MKQILVTPPHVFHDEKSRGNIIVKTNTLFVEFDTFLKNIPEFFANQGKTLRNKRNHVKVLEIDGKRINVKKYGIPPFFFNRIVYVLFRDTKAKRGFDYALKLHSLGINTPMPIGYYIEKKGLLLSTCYLATEQEDNIYNMASLDEVQEDISLDTIFCEYARYTALLHKNGIFHHDYTLENVMFRIENNKLNFILIDINQMSFHKPKFGAGCKCFERLKLKDEQLKYIATIYAQEMNYDAQQTLDKIMQLRARRAKLRKIRHRCKSILKIKYPYQQKK